MGLGDAVDGSYRDRSVDLDVLVLGSGVAGLSTAIRLARHGSIRVGILTKGSLSQSATRWAQGGIAAVLDGAADSTDLHLADTLGAGAGLCDVDAVRVLVDEGPERVKDLMALGAVFDREEAGRLAVAREGGHSTARVLHAGGSATGAEVERALVAGVEAEVSWIREGWFAIDLLTESGECTGVVALDPEGIPQTIRARNVVLATGGAGQLFEVTTNPPGATGDGIAMALRAGVAVADMEFMQFHPTALHHPVMPRPLLSEALRGHGALLRDVQGERFVDELSPRDVVSRAMAGRMADQGVDHLWLDATGIGSFSERFGNIASSLAHLGLDPSSEWLPVAPAAHYLSGGVLTDLAGATCLPGLWAAGEAACTGVHGANRLASNSLLEGLVFGARVADAIASGARSPSPTGAMAGMLGAAPGVPCLLIGDQAPWGATSSADSRSVADSGVVLYDHMKASEVNAARRTLQAAMTAGAGVLRSRSSLDRALGVVEDLEERLCRGARRVPGMDAPVRPTPAGARGADARGADARGGDARGGGELANLLTLAKALLCSAGLREETRGAHARAEFPARSDDWHRRIVHTGPLVACVPSPDGRSWKEAG